MLGKSQRVCLRSTMCGSALLVADEVEESPWVTGGGVVKAETGSVGTAVRGAGVLAAGGRAAVGGVFCGIDIIAEGGADIEFDDKAAELLCGKVD